MIKNIDDLKRGDKVNYAFFSNIEYAGKTFDGSHVILIDKYGNCKPIYTTLFIKHGSLDHDNS